MVYYNYFQFVFKHKLKANDRLRIIVTNSGEGLSQEDISKLFIPFERLNVINNIDGVGIGLVITKNLVELMGGMIGVESIPGESYSFWIDFTLLSNRN